MGHASAAHALAEQLKAIPECANVLVEDIFLHALKRNCHLLYGYFSFVVKKANWIYNWIYRRSEQVEKSAGSGFPLKRVFLNALGHLIDGTNADVVISTLPICSQMVSEYKQATGRRLMLVTCITDVTSHYEWIYPQTDLYLTAAPKIRDQLVEKGVPARSIVVSGIPVRSQFAQGGFPRTAGPRRLLIMGGGFGLLPKSAAFYERLNGLSGVKTTVIAGKNHSLYRRLCGRYPNITVLAYVDDVCTHMRAADLILSKPGGITLYESIFAEVPLLMFRPFLEQEKRNCAFALENGLGLLLSGEAEDCVPEIDRIVHDGDLLETVRQNMRRFKSCLDTDGLAELLLEYGQRGALA